jgi:hypothetical protein
MRGNQAQTLRHIEQLNELTSQTLAPILGQIRILKPATDRILAYETWLLEAVEEETSQTHR